MVVRGLTVQGPCSMGYSSALTKLDERNERFR